MIGISVAFEGRLGNNAELRFLPNGNAMASFSCAVEQPPKSGQPTLSEWVKVVSFGDDAAELVDRLTKGTLCYVEGRLNLNKWTDNAGKEHCGLNIVASLVQPMGQIGRKPLREDAPKPDGPVTQPRPMGARPQAGQRRGAYQGISDGRATRQPVPAGGW